MKDAGLETMLLIDTGVVHFFQQREEGDTYIVASAIACAIEKEDASHIDIEAYRIFNLE